MKRPQAIAGMFLTPLLAASMLPLAPIEAIAENSFEHSDFIETEQPELTQETKDLISAYQKSPTEENYLALREMVIANYDAVLDRKEEKLAELKVETAGKPGGEETVAEMEDIVQDMYATYWNRINSSMLRFTDSRLLKWRTADAANYGYIPVMGAGESIYVSRTPVTNAQYAAYVQATGADAPANWENGAYPEGEDDYPVNFVSADDAQAYCAWLTEQDGMNAYRLPNESEWELAAGHMPKDADFNCGVADGRVSVEAYEGITRGAHGAVDFWGNVWEWTSTVRSDEAGVITLGVKGGAWNSERTDCRTENRAEGRDGSQGYEDVGFRVIQVKNGEEPEQKVELATLAAPTVQATGAAPDAIELSWQPVDGATEYQLFEYFEDTGFVQMMGTSQDTSVVVDGLEPGSTHSYIVQPISYVEICDNVSAGYKVTATCQTETEEDENAGGGVGEGPEESGEPEAGSSEDEGQDEGEAPDGAGDSNADEAAGQPSLDLVNAGGLDCWLYSPADATEDMPLIVYLHGVTGKGDNPSVMLAADDFARWVSDGTLGEIPAYVLMPHIPADAGDWASIGESVIAAIEEVKTTYGIDAGNVSLTGFSMGGTGAWSIAAAYPDEFSRIAPCAGGIRAKRTALAALGEMPIWTFVGSEDNVVKPQSAIDFVDRLSKTNPSASVTVLEGAGHADVPALAYLDEGADLIGWLIGAE